MREFELYTKTTLDSVHVIESQKHISVFVHKNFMSTGESYKLDKKHFNKLQAYKSVSALLKFVKANQIDDSANDNGLDSAAKCDVSEVISASSTSCPVPAPTPAKSSEQGQGILFVEFETAGRGKDNEIIEISVVDSAENVLFHSRVSPTKPLKDVPTGYPALSELWARFGAVIGRSDIAFYNADFSKRALLRSVGKAFDTPTPEHFYTLFPYNKVICVGERYKEFNNYCLGYFRNYGLQHINSACGQSGLSWRDVSNSASGNAIKSARLYKYLDHKAVA